MDTFNFACINTSNTFSKRFKESRGIAGIVSNADLDQQFERGVIIL